MRTFRSANSPPSPGARTRAQAHARARAHDRMIAQTQNFRQAHHILHTWVYPSIYLYTSLHMLLHMSLHTSSWHMHSVCMFRDGYKCRRYYAYAVCARARSRALSFYMWAQALLRRALAKLGARDVRVMACMAVSIERRLSDRNECVHACLRTYSCFTHAHTYVHVHAYTRARACTHKCAPTRMHAGTC